MEPPKKLEFARITVCRFGGYQFQEFSFITMPNLQYQISSIYDFFLP